MGQITGVNPPLIGRSENVVVEFLIKICEALYCGIDDIMDISPIEDKELKRG